VSLRMFCHPANYYWRMNIDMKGKEVKTVYNANMSADADGLPVTRIDTGVKVLPDHIVVTKYNIAKVRCKACSTLFDREVLNVINMVTTEECVLSKKIPCPFCGCGESYPVNQKIAEDNELVKIIDDVVKLND